MAISDISALIPIVDDDKDEADIQFFIASLEVVDAVNMDLIDIGRTFSRGIIVDNDGKWTHCNCRKASVFLFVG